MRRKDNFLFPDISREKALATSPSNHKLLSCVESKSALRVKVLKYDELIIFYFTSQHILKFCIVDGRHEASDINSNTKKKPVQKRYPLSYFSHKIGVGEGLGQKEFRCVVNEGEDDELELWGYKENHAKLLVTVLAVLMTGGLLGLVLYWLRHYWVYCTMTQCPLDEATTILAVVSRANVSPLYQIYSTFTLYIRIATEASTPPGMSRSSTKSSTVNRTSSFPTTSREASEK